MKDKLIFVFKKCMRSILFRVWLTTQHEVGPRPFHSLIVQCKGLKALKNGENCIAACPKCSAGDESPSLYLGQLDMHLPTPTNWRPCLIPHWQFPGLKVGAV